MLIGFEDTYDAIGTGEHLAVGLSRPMDKPTTGQAFLVGPSKPRPVDHWSGGDQDPEMPSMIIALFVKIDYITF